MSYFTKSCENYDRSYFLTISSFRHKHFSITPKQYLNTSYRSALLMPYIWVGIKETKKKNRHIYINIYKKIVKYSSPCKGAVTTKRRICSLVFVFTIWKPSIYAQWMVKLDLKKLNYRYLKNRSKTLSQVAFLKFQYFTKKKVFKLKMSEKLIFWSIAIKFIIFILKISSLIFCSVPFCRPPAPLARMFCAPCIWSSSTQVQSV